MVSEKVWPWIGIAILFFGTSVVFAQTSDDEILELFVVPFHIELSDGETLKMSADAFYADGTYVRDVQGVEWHSSDPESVSIVKKRTIFAAKPGAASLYATLNGFESAQPGTVIVGDSSVDEMNIEMNITNVMVGQTVDVKVSATFNDGEIEDITGAVTWQRVTNDDAFEVDGRQLTGLNEGYGYLIAHFDGNKSDALRIDVNDSGHLDLKLLEGATTLAVDSSVTLTPRAGSLTVIDSDDVDVYVTAGII